MAVPNYPLNHPSAVKRWSTQTFKQALKNCYASRFFGSGKGSLVQVFNEEIRQSGDKVTVSLRQQLQGAGISGDGTQEGNEEALDWYTDSFIVDQLRHAVRTGGKMSEQRVTWTSRDEARDGLADWWADRIDTSFFNQLAGNTGETDTRYTGMQAPSAPTTVILANNEGTTASLSATFTMKLDYIDYMLEKAKTRDYPIRPIMGQGGEANYVLFVTEQQLTDMMIDTGTNQWSDLQKQAGIRGSKNPVFSGADIVYRGVAVHSTTRLPRTTVTATLDLNRAVFCGAQAAAAGFCKQSGPTTFQWVEEMFDYNNQLGVAAGCMFGVKKLTFNSADHGTIALITAGQDHG